MLVYFVLSCLFVAALWSPAGKGLTSWLLLCLWCFVTFPNVPWSPSALSPPVNIFTDRSMMLLFCRSFVLFMSLVCHVLRLFIAALWSPVRIGLTS